jgi:hypothetical protein
MDWERHFTLWESTRRFVHSPFGKRPRPGLGYQQSGRGGTTGEFAWVPAFHALDPGGAAGAPEVVRELIVPYTTQSFQRRRALPEASQ